MLSDNWVVQNLENALETWNQKLAEIWQLITQSPTQFKGGTIWNVIVNIHGVVQAIGLALLVLFFVVGVMKTCGSFAELKKPEHALKVFIRFALAKAAVTYGLELMMALFNIVQGLISTIMTAAGFGTAGRTVLPSEIVTAVEDCGFFESIPLWARPRRMWERALSNPTPLSAWKARLLYWLALFFPYSLLPRPWLTRTPRRFLWYGAISGSLYLIC